MHRRGSRAGKESKTFDLYGEFRSSKPCSGTHMKKALCEEPLMDFHFRVPKSDQ